MDEKNVVVSKVKVMNPTEDLPLLFLLVLCSVKEDQLKYHNIKMQDTVSVSNCLCVAD